MLANSLLFSDKVRRALILKVGDLGVVVGIPPKDKRFAKLERVSYL